MQASLPIPATKLLQFQDLVKQHDLRFMGNPHMIGDTAWVAIDGTHLPPGGCNAFWTDWARVTTPIREISSPAWKRIARRIVGFFIALTTAGTVCAATTLVDTAKAACLQAVLYKVDPDEIDIARDKIKIYAGQDKFSCLVPGELHKTVLEGPGRYKKTSGPVLYRVEVSGNPPRTTIRMIVPSDDFSRQSRKRGAPPA